MKSKAITSLLVVVFLVGVALVFNNIIQHWLISNMSETLMPTTSSQIEENWAIEASFDFEEVETLTILDVLKAQIKKSKLPVIGSMAIPSVDLQIPILKGVGRDALAVGAGTMKPTQVMGKGNYSLAGHYFEDQDILFGPLYHLKMGDKIYLTDLKYAYIYETSMIEVVEATAVFIIEDVTDEALLTLITCAEEGTKRLAVQATLIEKVALDELQDTIF